jgi:hypothetical protein
MVQPSLESALIYLLESALIDLSNHENHKFIKYQKDQKYYIKPENQSSYSDNLSKLPFLRPS